MAITAVSAPIGACKPDVPPFYGTDSKWHNHPDTPIITALYRWQRAHLALNAFGNTAPEPAEEAGLWQIIDLADDEVGRNPAATPEGIMAKLWLAIYHTDPKPDAKEAAIRADLAWFERQGDALDWNTRVIFEAIRSLAVMAQASSSSGKEG